MKDIVIIGSGGFAKEVAFLIEQINKQELTWNLLGFIDMNVGGFNGKYQIIGSDSWLQEIDHNLDVAFGIGDPSLIRMLYKLHSRNANLSFPNLIHPNVVGDWDRISLGLGNIICAGNIFTTDIRIGSFNIFNLDCTIGHDAIIGNFNVINPSVNISGGVHITDEILIGTGAQILQYKTIKEKTTIGAGSLVTKDIPESGVYVGVPIVKIK